MRLSEEELTSIQQRATGAADEVSRMCTAEGGPGASWRWSIPANPERDSDLILTASIADVPVLLAEVKHLTERITDLHLDIREATNVLAAAVPAVGQNGKLGHAVMTVCNALLDARGSSS